MIADREAMVFANPWESYSSLGASPLGMKDSRGFAKTIASLSAITQNYKAGNTNKFYYKIRDLVPPKAL